MDLKDLFKIRNYRTCPRCKGKGHVVDELALIFIPVVSWVIAYLERDDEDSLTRTECPRCKGRGKIQ